MSDVSNLRATILPKSDQLNAEQLLPGPMTITVTGVTWGTDEQPVVVHYEGDQGRPYKPCKSMRKLLIFAWGDDGNQWVGKSMTLYNNPDVKFGGVKVGGIRISHLSHIERDIQISLTATKGRKEPITVSKISTQSTPIDHLVNKNAYDQILDAAANSGLNELKAAWEKLPAEVRRELGRDTLDKYKAIAEAAQAPEHEPKIADDDPF